MNRKLWTVQGLLMLVFLFAGGSKLVSPSEVLEAQFPLPTQFMRFIGVVEILGALGLVLPGLLRIQTGLTPLAATGLVSVMIGAVVVTLVDGAGAAALFPLTLGLLAAFVAYGRWRAVPLRESSRRPMLWLAESPKPHRLASESRRWASLRHDVQGVRETEHTARRRIST